MKAILRKNCKGILRKAAAVVLTLIMLTSLVQVGLADYFPDVPSGSWYQSAVDYVSTQGIMNGTNGRFKPTGSMNRAMFVQTLANNTKNYTKQYGSSGFSDVPSGSWMSSPVKWASSNGIVSGTGNGKFNPHGLVTREQMVTMLYNYAIAVGLDTTVSGSSHTYFSDWYRVSNWARTPFAWAISKGIISGSGNYLNPKSTAQRCQVASMLHKGRSVLPKSNLISKSTPKDPSADWLAAFGMSRTELSKKGVKQVDGLSGSYGYEFTMYPQATFFFQWDSTSYAKPGLALTNLSNILPELVGKSAGQANAMMGGSMKVYYQDFNAMLESTSGWYADIETQNFKFYILLESRNGDRFSSNDTVIISLTGSAPAPSGGEEEGEDLEEEEKYAEPMGYAECLRKTFAEIDERYGPATYVETTTDYGTTFKYYSFKYLPGANYAFYVTSPSVAVGSNHPPTHIFGRIGDVCPELSGFAYVNFGHYFQDYIFEDGILNYHMLPVNGVDCYDITYTKFGYEYFIRVPAGDEDDELTDDQIVTISIFGHQ